MNIKSQLARFIFAIDCCVEKSKDLRTGGFRLRRMKISSISLSKMALHLAEHPSSLVIGILLSSQDIIRDVLPLFHGPFSLTSPMLEVAFSLAERLAEERGLRISGLYSANRVVKQKSEPITMDALLRKMSTTGPIYHLRIDNEKLSEMPFLLAAISASNGEESIKIEGESEEGSRMAAMMCAKRNCFDRGNIYDFDDYVENVQLDWLNTNVDKEIAVLERTPAAK